MKQSDIEEFKAILYVATGLYAYNLDIILLSIIMWSLGGISLLAGCVVAYYEQKITR